MRYDIVRYVNKTKRDREKYEDQVIEICSIWLANSWRTTTTTKTKEYSNDTVWSCKADGHIRLQVHARKPAFSRSLLVDYTNINSSLVVEWVEEQNSQRSRRSLNGKRYKEWRAKNQNFSFISAAVLLASPRHNSFGCIKQKVRYNNKFQLSKEKKGKKKQVR